MLKTKVGIFRGFQDVEFKRRKKMVSTVFQNAEIRMEMTLMVYDGEVKVRNAFALFNSISIKILRHHFKVASHPLEKYYGLKTLQIY